MNLEEKTITSETVYKGRIITLKKDTALLPDGNSADREFIEHPGGVCVAAITENNEILVLELFGLDLDLLTVSVTGVQVLALGEESIFRGLNTL